MSGPATGTLLMTPISRATPEMPRQSPRFGVSSMSITTSSSCRCAASGSPTGARSSRLMMPSASSPSPSSAAEHSIPWDSTPRILLRRILRPSGRRAPTSATGARMPANTFGAPHTTESVSPLPASTLHTLRRSASGCAPTSSTWATTMSSPRRASGSALSTSRPAAVSCSTRVSVSTGASTHSRSHCSLTFIGTAPGSAGRCRRTGADRRCRSAAGRGARRPCRRRSRCSVPSRC